MWICPECRSLSDDPQPVCERDGTPLAEVTAHQSKSRYPLLGKIVGDRYHLIGGLGQGGLGTVYLARHRHLHQLFAVKFLEVEAIVAPGTESEEDVKDQYRRDFLREAQVASLIRHDAVVRVTDFGEHGRLPFLVMEYVPGPSLLHVLGKQGRFEPAEGLAIARRIAEALDAFHERRLVHRDLKPANVILDPRGNGRLTLVDLGLVKDLSGPGGKASTHPLALRGTPGYLAPEQVPAWVLAGAGVRNPGEKQPVDARVDLYALGVILYEMLAGVSPYPEGSNTQVIVYTCTREAIPIGAVTPRVSLLPGLAELIHDTMARDPERRPQSAAAFLERLDRISMGLVHSGSWPQLHLPDRRRSTAPPDSPASSGERRPSQSALVPPPALSAPAEPEVDEEEETVVYADQLQAPPGDATEALALAPTPEAHDEEATVEADIDDSLDRLYDAVDDSVVPDPRDSAPPTVERPAIASAPPTVERPAIPAAFEPPADPLDADPPRRGVWIAVLAVAFAALGAAWWLWGRRADERPAAVITVGGEPSAPAPATVDVTTPPEAVTAASTTWTDAGPTVAAVPASAPAPASKPHLANAVARPLHPAPPSAPDADALLERARRAFESQDNELALGLYQQVLERIQTDHPEYWAVRQRVDFLRHKLGKP